MKAPLIKQLDLGTGDKCPAVRLAARIVLGMELKHLKQANGYEGGGTYLAFRDQSKREKRLRWPDYCLAMAGISDRSASLHYQCAEAVKTRLRCLPSLPGGKLLLRQMEQQPSTMTAAERADMIQKIIVLGLTQGETASQLLREYRGMRVPKVEEGGDKSHRALFAPRHVDADDSYRYAHQRRTPEETEKLIEIVLDTLRDRARKRGF